MVGNLLKVAKESTSDILTAASSTAEGDMTFKNIQDIVA